MFSDREIKFNELMEAEVYEDNYVVGLKVKTPNKSQSSAPNTNIGIVESSTATESLEKHTVDHKHVDEDEVQNRSCNAKSPDSSGKGELSQIRDFVDAVIQQVNGNKSSSEKEKTERDSRDPNMSSENEDYDSVQVNKNGSPCQKKRNQKELNEDSEKQNSNSTQINENDSLSQKEETEKDSLDLTKSSSEGNENAIEKSSFNDDDIQAMITLLNS